MFKIPGGQALGKVGRIAGKVGGKALDFAGTAANLAFPIMMFMPPPGMGGGGAPGAAGMSGPGVGIADDYETALNREMQRQTFLQNSMRGM